MNLEQRQQARDHLARAQIALDADQLDQAGDHLRITLKFEPDSSSARLLEAQLYLKLNQPKQTLAALDVHDHYHPLRREMPDVITLRANALARLGETRMARGLLQNIIDALPDDPRGHRALAGLHLQTGDQDRAIAALERVVALTPSDAQARRQLADLLAHDNPQTAIDVLAADATLLRQADVRLQLARWCVQAQRLRDAVEYYRSLLFEFHDDAALHAEAGRVFDQVGDDVAAVACLQTAIARTYPHGVTLLGELARVHMHAGRFEAAGRCWWTLSRGEGDRSQALAGLLLCATLTGRTSLAARVRRVFAAGTSVNQRRMIMAELWQHAAAGEQLARIAQGRMRYQPWAFSPLQSILRQAQHKLEAQAHDHPDRADAQYHLAMCLTAQGQLDKAREAVASALKVNPKYRAARELAGELGVEPTILRLAA